MDVGDEALAVVEVGEVAEVGSAGEVEGGEAGFVAAAGGLFDEAEVAFDVVEDFGAANGSVTGDDGCIGLRQAQSVRVGSFDRLRMSGVGGRGIVGVGWCGG